MRTTRQIYAPAILLATITLAALFSALLGNGMLKGLACVSLSVPLLVFGACVFRGWSR
jgi:hypothetical protein